MDNQITSASHSGSTHRTVVVDLDGTLVNTDMLVENLFLFLGLHPLRILEVILWLFSGKAHFKRCLADAVVPDVARLPYNKELLAWLEQQRTEGASLILATASDLRIARKVAEHSRLRSARQKRFTLCSAAAPPTHFGGDASV